MNNYGSLFVPLADKPKTEYAVVMYDEGATFFGTEKTFDEAAAQWAYHAEVKSHQILTVVERTITYTDWTTGPAKNMQGITPCVCGNKWVNIEGEGEVTCTDCGVPKNYSLARWFAAKMTEKHTTEGNEFATTTYVAHRAGPKYTRISQGTADGASVSVHCFIENATGAVFKAESWKKPAKGVRYASVVEALEASDWAGGYLYTK